MKKTYNPVVTLTLGWLGVHRYMAGEIGMGILYTCTFGLFTIGWIIDIIRSLSNDNVGFEPNVFLSRSDPSKIWSKWDYIDDEGANDRKGRGVGGRLKLESINKKNCTGRYVSRYGVSIYRTTLTKCTCPDFGKRHVPCKHMYNLAYNLGLNINLDYSAMLKRALAHPGDSANPCLLYDFYAYRNAFEIMMADKIVCLIKEDGGIMSQVDLKGNLNNEELKFYDYTIEMLISSGRIRKEKESNRVIFYVADFDI